MDEIKLIISLAPPSLVDATSALRLSLVGRLGRSRDTQTLFGAINHTCTLSGARRLRAALLEPPNGKSLCFVLLEHYPTMSFLSLTHLALFV